MGIDINKLLGLPLMEVIDFSFTEKKVFILLRRVTESELCPICQCACKDVRSYPTRTVRGLDILGRKTYLSIESRQFECKDCKRYFIEDLELVEGNHGLTKRYESYLYGMIKGVNIQQICLKEDICWVSLNAIHKSYSALESSQRDVDWDKVKSISIDEISIRKGKRNFACVLRDPDSDKVLDMLEKRDMATLKAYFIEKGVVFL